MKPLEEGSDKALDLLHYIYFALPIHRAQMEAIIEETEKNNLLLGGNFSTLIDEIEESVRKSNTIKDRLLTSDLSDEHFDEIKPMLNQLVDNTHSVQSSVSEIMVSLQYQDSTKQVLTHIQNDLTDIGKEIQGLESSKVALAEPIKTRLKTGVAKHYTMAKERDIFKVVTGIDVTASSSDTDEEITFF